MSPDVARHRETMQYNSKYKLHFYWINYYLFQYCVLQLYDYKTLIEMRNTADLRGHFLIWTKVSPHYKYNIVAVPKAVQASETDASLQDYTQHPPI